MKDSLRALLLLQIQHIIKASVRYFLTIFSPNDSTSKTMKTGFKLMYCNSGNTTHF